MLPHVIRSVIERELGAAVVSVRHVSGGSINETARVETATKTVFVKWNNAARFPAMFDAEAKGLELLSQYSTFCVPKVMACKCVGETAFLLLEYLDSGKADWHAAGIALAGMHRHSAEQFGLGHDNYIGSLQQVNTQHSAWAEFFAHERILRQVQLAMDSGLLDRTDRVKAESFCKRIGELFPHEPPALLHGDLWNGNFMFTAKGPSIYDPAVYYGHREMDLAMTQLFGGFDDAFYTAYHEAFPLEKSWKKRVRYCNLYPLLVHVNLFGGGYAAQVRSVLSEF